MLWQRILHRPSVDETRAFLHAGFGADLQFEAADQQAGRIDLYLDGIVLPTLFICHVRSTAETEIRGNRPDHNYALYLPVRGRFAVGVGRSGFCSDPHRGVLFSRPTAPANLVRNEGHAGALTVRFPQTAVARQLAALLGEPGLGTLPDFAPAMDLTDGYGRSLAQYLMLAVTDFKRAVPWNSIMLSAFEDFMLSKLLLSHPHSYTDALRRAEKAIAPRDVKHALDYMQEMLGSPITIADIAAASGIAGRTLFKHFQDYHGISPMRYLRNARFERARDALLQADPEGSVTAIAMNWGFSHMGRFSVEYRRRFGESPSETLRRRRPRRGRRVG
jgi:AraC-like DNA-binding protein